MAKILVVEDDQFFTELIRQVVASMRHTSDMVPNGHEALTQLRFNEYDLIILDWGLPGLPGVDVLKQYRASGGKTAILMLTAMSQLEHKEAGLDAGADDYLTKPFESRELAARIRALLRRQPELTESRLKIRDIELDPKMFKVTVAGKHVQLQPAEFTLLEFFMRHPDQVFSTEALTARVWPSESMIVPDSVRTFVKRIRQKTDRPGQPSLISTVSRLGYMLESGDLDKS
jgi:DNA-binding response OmpR family regulator